jgi:hypothetical protein
VTPDQIRSIPDPAVRAAEAEGFMRRGRAAIGEVQAVRDAAVAELAALGWSQRRIAKHLGLSPARAAQIVPSPNGKNPHHPATDAGTVTA